MKKVLSAVVAVWLLSGVASAAPNLSAADFLPVAQVPEEQRAELSAVKEPEKVTVEDDSVVKKPVVKAATTQDAINKAVEMLYANDGEGCQVVALPDGKLGLVSCGTGTYNKDMKNLTAQRRSQRFAYVQAFMNAKANMVRFFNGASSESLASFVYSEEGADSDTGGTFSSSSKIEINNKSVAAAVLKGYVTYNVRDDFENATVYVTLVSTPRTQGRYNRPSGDTLMAETLGEGLNAILAEIQNGVVPPIGGRIVEVPKTGEIAFVGFGSAVVRQVSQPAARANVRRSARKVAGLRAQSALCGIITGERVEASLSESEKAEQSFTETEGGYENIKDPIDELEPDGDRAAAEKFKAEFRSQDEFHEAITTAHKGMLPPGVTQRAWLDDDGAFAYGIAVYVPSVTNAAAAVEQDIRNSEILQPVEPHKAQPEEQKKDDGGKPKSKPEKKDPGVLKPGISGTVEQSL
ncbi:MAG: hypothetical protein IJU98_12085 [Synergistaceae bacterium]|nr:hypothetical protein [Synergistaceae bacterium]